MKRVTATEASSLSRGRTSSSIWLASELAKLLEAAGHRQTWTAELHGAGAIAQGTNNVVAGAGGIAAGRDVNGPRIIKPES